MTKRILITGASGFVGKNLKRFFENKYVLFTPTHSDLDFREENSVEKYFKKNSFDYILHCASVGGVRGVKDDITTLDDNLKMVKNILSFKEKNTRLILFSSGAMYDKSKPIKKVKEDEIENSYPTDLYGKSKKMIAQLVKNRKDVICLNIFACYGYGEKESRFPTYAITQNLKHRKIEINQNVIFDYLFIDDLCKIIDHFINNIPSENIINVTPTLSVDLKTIAKIVNSFSDFQSEIIVKNNDLGNEYTGDNSRLMAEIPKFKFTKIENGLKLLFEDIKNNL